MAKIIAIYGKGGIGKSSTATNIAAACSVMGYKVMLIGCDPKSDSSIALLHGKRIPTILSLMRNNKNIEKDDIIYKGYNNIQCLEVGGPEPGIGCAGRGIIVAIGLLNDIYPEFKDNDLIIYDVPGDVVCGGFFAPIKKGGVNEVYILTSGEYMSLYAANNLCKGFNKINLSVGGIICNSRNNSFEEELTREFSKKINTKFLGVIPKDQLVQIYEREGSCVVEKNPNSIVSKKYFEIAKIIIENTTKSLIEPLSDLELRELTNKYI